MIDPLAVELPDAIAVAGQLDDRVRRCAVDLLRAAQAVMSGICELDTYKQHYAWKELAGAVAFAASRVGHQGASIDDARLLYVHALCIAVRDRAPEATQATDLPQYRVVHYLLNPFAGTRIAVAVLVRTPDGNTHAIALPKVPSAECLGSNGAHRLISAFQPYLAKIDCFESLPAHFGPHFVLGPSRMLPTATTWRQWITQAVFGSGDTDA